MICVLYFLAYFKDFLLISCHFLSRLLDAKVNGLIVVTCWIRPHKDNYINNDSGRRYTRHVRPILQASHVFRPRRTTPRIDALLRQKPQLVSLNDFHCEHRPPLESDKPSVSRNTLQRNDNTNHRLSRLCTLSCWSHSSPCNIPWAKFSHSFAQTALVISLCKTLYNAQRATMFYR